ncbi:MAG: antiviral reverse transcriptase Drt3b, partial [Massilia sp.]
MLKKIKKIKFKKHDFLRVLLTDTLPYEVPILFSNNGYYNHLTNQAEKRLLSECKLNFLGKIDYTIPYDYSIKKDSIDYRSLSIVHPAVQRDFCDLYGKYSNLMIGLCSRSNYSLRKPARIATHYFEKRRASKFLWAPSLVEVENDGFSEQSKNASSFFVYERYNLIYKFYESAEFHDLEKRFAGMRSLDISKCFNHIYTHSFTWAAKSKEYGKENISLDTFEGAFDKVMQRSNYNETNGIIIGPEISRIFAEVILQYIDVWVEKKLEECGYKNGHHYEIRRYVDDYFLFFNDVQVADAAQRSVTKTLSDFKLYLNDSKTKTLSRPFVSGQSSAKIELAALVDKLFSTHTRTKIEIKEEFKRKLDAAKEEAAEENTVRPPFSVKYVGNENRLATVYIRDVKHVISQNLSSYEGVSNYFFSVIGQKIYALIENISISDST